MTNFLDLEARLGGEFLHPGGCVVTEVLLEQLSLPPGGLALELGCGTGSTAAWVASKLHANVVALDRSPTMLAATQARLKKECLSESIHLVRADASWPLPFPDASFDAVYAESVIALLEAEPAIGECARVLRPGGRLALIERIWKPNVSPALVGEINLVSRRLFGIPAATSEPYSREDWLQLLHQAGLTDVRARPIETLLPARCPSFHLRRRLSRGRRYLRHPQMLYRSLWFKVMIRRYAALWSHLESYLFLAQRREARDDCS